MNLQKIINSTTFKLSISAILASWLFALSWLIFRGSQTNLLFYTIYMWLPGIVSIFYILQKNQKPMDEKLNLKNLWKNFIGKINSSWISGILGVFFAAFFPFAVYAIFNLNNLFLENGFSLNNLFLRMPYILTIGIFLAFGEEIAWREIIFKKSIEEKINPTMFTSIIWIIWHIPLILLFSYDGDLNKIQAVFSYSIMIFLFGLILGKLKNLSQSLFLITFLHAFHNLMQQNFFRSFLQNGTKYEAVAGEFGFITIIAYLIVLFGLNIIYWKPLKNKS